MPPLAVVFDLDGTLIDSAGDIADAVNEALTALERPTRPVEEVKKMIGHGVRKLLGEALGTTDAALIEEGRRHYAPAYEARLTRSTRPYAGILEAVAALRDSGAALAVATNKPARFTGTLLEALGFTAAGVTAWASADEAGAQKPDPAVLLLALSRLGAPPGARVVYVGDMPIDVETARRAGAAAVGVSWGFFPDEIAAAGADVLVRRPEELAAACLSLGS